MNVTIRAGSSKDSAAIRELYLTVSEISGGLARRPDEISIEYVDGFVAKSLHNGVLFIAESAGQDQALRTIDHLPYPDQLYGEVCEMIFPGGKPKPLEERLRELIDNVPKMRTELAAEVTTGTSHDLSNRRLRLEGVQAQLEQLVAETGEWHRQASELHRHLAERAVPGDPAEL